MNDIVSKVIAKGSKCGLYALSMYLIYQLAVSFSENDSTEVAEHHE